MLKRGKRNYFASKRSGTYTLCANLSFSLFHMAYDHPLSNRNTYTFLRTGTDHCFLQNIIYRRKLVSIVGSLTCTSLAVPQQRRWDSTTSYKPELLFKYCSLIILSSYNTFTHYSVRQFAEFYDSSQSDSRKVDNPKLGLNDGVIVSHGIHERPSSYRPVTFYPRF